MLQQEKIITYSSQNLCKYSPVVTIHMVNLELEALRQPQITCNRLIRELTLQFTELRPSKEILLHLLVIRET